MYLQLQLSNMFVQFTTKYGKVAVNPDKVLFVNENGKYTRIEIEDGTPIDVYESLVEICAVCDVKKSIENVKV